MDVLLAEQEKNTENIKRFTSGLKPLTNDSSNEISMNNTERSEKLRAEVKDTLEIIDSDIASCYSTKSNEKILFSNRY